MAAATPTLYWCRRATPPRSKKLSDALHAIPEVTGILSYVDNAGASIPPEFVPGDTLGLLVSGGYTRMVLTVDADTEGDGAFALVERVRATVQQYYPDNYYLAGQGVSTYDLMDTITADMVKVNLLAIGAVFLILLLMKRQLLLPIILVLSIETAIWINLAIPYFRGQYVFYIAYLIISSVQLGATVDYAILFSDRYQEFRETLGRKEAVAATVSAVTTSVSTTGSAMAVVGFLMGAISTNQLLGQLGNFLGVGSLVSLAIVLSALPGFLYLADPLIIKKEKTAEGGLTEMKHRFVRRVSALALAGCLLAGSSLPAFCSSLRCQGRGHLCKPYGLRCCDRRVRREQLFRAGGGHRCGPRQLHCRAQHDHERCRGAERRYGHGACDRGRQALL